MAHFIHQFSTETKRLRVSMAAYLCVHVLSWMLTIVCLKAEPWYDTLSSIPETGVLALLPILGSIIMAALLFRADPVASPTAFWRTLPWSKWSMGMAKTAFLLFVIAIPAGLASLAEPWWFRVSYPELAAEFVGGTLTALAASSLSCVVIFHGLKTWLLVAGVAAFYAIVSQWTGSISLLPHTSHGNIAILHIVTSFAFLFLAFTFIRYVVDKSRMTGIVAVVLAVVSVFGAGKVRTGLSDRAILHPDPRLELKEADYSPLDGRIIVSFLPPQTSQHFNAMKNEVCATVDGVDSHDDAIVENYVAGIDQALGRSRPGLLEASIHLQSSYPNHGRNTGSVVFDGHVYFQYFSLDSVASFALDHRTSSHRQFT